MNMKRLLDLRETEKLNQKDIAKILNISQQGYSAWETGEKIIPIKKLNKLCNYYNVSLDYILCISNKKRTKNLINIDEFNKEEIGKRIKIIRAKNNLSLRKLAKELNTTSSTISAYETGKTLILTAFAYQITKKYKISLDWIYGKKDNQEIE